MAAPWTSRLPLLAAGLLLSRGGFLPAQTVPAALPEITARASAALAAGDNTAAERGFREALALDPASVPLHNNLALVLSREGHDAEAIDQYRQALVLRPGDRITTRNLGVAFYRARRYREAAPLLQATAASEPSFGTLELAGLAWFATDEYPAAIRDLEAARVLQPDDLETLTMLGRAYLHTQNFAAVTPIFERLLASHPDSAEVHVMLATAYDRLFREDDALREFQAAEKVDPLYPGLHTGLGSIYFRNENFPAATAELLQELGRHPDDAVANCLLGRILLRQARPAEAVARFDTALSANPNYSDALRERGEALVALHRPAEAIVSLRRAVALDPGDARAHFTLGTALRTAGDTAEGNAERALAGRLLSAAHATSSP